MSYLRKKEYKIIPDRSFSVVHNCSGCGRKTRYINTKRFRVNANGNKLDVWLIYQCERCKHTLNLSVYERQRADKIPQAEYRAFLNNDEELAEDYGKSFSFFMKNRVEADCGNIVYSFVDITGKSLGVEDRDYHDGDLFAIKNPYGIGIRPEKQAAEILALSRSMVKKMLDNRQIIIRQKKEELEIEIVKLS